MVPELRKYLKKQKKIFPNKNISIFSSDFMKKNETELLFKKIDEKNRYFNWNSNDF